MVTATIGLSLLKVTVAAALGLLIVRLAARRAAAVRHAVLVMTFIALVAIPVASLVAPPHFVLVSQAGSPLAATLAPLVVEHHADTAPRPAEQSEPGTTWRTLVFAAWVSGVALCLLPQLGALLQARRLRRAARPWAAALADAPPIGGRRSRVQVLIHAGITGPMTSGIISPTILLPADAPRWSAQDLHRALTHENAHIARGDVLVHALAGCVCAASWFHPLAWACWRALRREAERACDDAVIAFHEPIAYAQQLLGLARRQDKSPLAALPAMANRSELTVRIRAVLDRNQRRERLGRRQAAAIAIAGALGVATVAPVRPILAAAHRNAPSGATFSSASVLESTGGEPLSMQWLPDGRVRIVAAPFRRLVRLAYGVQHHAIVDAPAWIDSDRFDISATTAPGATPQAVVEMLRSLLTERFGLRIRHEIRPLPVFVLGRAPTPGTTLRPSTGCRVSSSSLPHPDSRTIAALPPCGFRVGHGRLEGTGVDLNGLAEALSTPLERAVLVHGPALGRFDFALTWNPSGHNPAAGLIEALSTQLGLVIEEQTRDVPVIVIQSVRRPA